MGAIDFTDREFGKDASDAYRRACQAALHEFGHEEGYNGTISTTNGFVDLTEKWTPKRVRQEAKMMKEQFEEMRREAAATSASDFNLAAWRERLERATGFYPYDVTNKTGLLANLRRLVKVHRETERTPLRDMDANFIGMFLMDHDSRFLPEVSKRGHCGCLKTTYKNERGEYLYLFFGLAAS